MEEGLYIYGIIPAQEFIPMEEDIQMIPYKNISAVAVKVGLDDFIEENFKAKIEKDPTWLEEKILRHNHIISKLAEKTTVVPLKFGTIFKSKKAVEEMLEEKYQNFLKIIFNLNGKKEWGVKIYCDMDKLKTELVTTNQFIKDIDMSIKNKPEGVAYFLTRKRETLILEESEKKMEEYATTIHGTLAKLTDKNCLNKLQPRELTKKKSDMILNGAYLIQNSKVDEFQSKVSELKQIYENFGLKFKISGPWPAYSFTNEEKK